MSLLLLFTVIVSIVIVVVILIVVIVFIVIVTAIVIVIIVIVLIVIVIVMSRSLLSSTLLIHTSEHLNPALHNQRQGAPAAAPPTKRTNAATKRCGFSFTTVYRLMAGSRLQRLVGAPEPAARMTTIITMITKCGSNSYDDNKNHETATITITKLRR